MKTEYIVSIQNLTKHYGSIHAVEDLCLDIPEKSVFGILGPNGSGKTTTLGMLLDVINPTSGSYSWFGNKPAAEIRQKIGSILETPAFYPYLSAVENLQIIAEIKNTGYEAIDDVLTQVGLHERRHSLYRTFSLGMKQRLALASALLCDPQVMILDEPTNGLDPKGIAEIRQLIKNIASQGKTIILASHLLDEVQKVCTHFAVLNKGKLLYAGPVQEVSEGDLRIEVAAGDPSFLSKWLEKFSPVKHIEAQQEYLLITLMPDSSVSDLSRYIFEGGFIPTHLVVLHKSLENQFLDILNQSK